MPIGTIIGWLIGQAIIGFILIRSNWVAAGGDLESTKALTLGLSLELTAVLGLVGTGIELLVR